MTEKMDKLVEDVTQVRIDVAKIVVVLETNTESLVEHVRRTDLLEKQLNKQQIPFEVVKYVVATAGLAYTVLKLLTLLSL